MADLPKNQKAAAEHAKEARDRRIFELWLACWTEEEIAEIVGITKQAVSLICQESADLPKLDKGRRAAAEHATDFEAPIYNIWTQEEIAEAVGEPRKTIADATASCGEIGNLAKSAKAAAEHATEARGRRIFEPLARLLDAGGDRRGRRRDSGRNCEEYSKWHDCRSE